MPISKIKSDGINDAAITTAKLADSAVNSAKIGVDVIAAEDLAANSVTVSEISNGAVTSAKLDTNIDIAGTLDVTGVLTADGNASVAGNLTVDTTTLVVDATNNHVGFGTATPANPIDATLAAGGDFVAKFQNTTSVTPYNVVIKDAPSGANGYPLLQVVDDAGTDTYFRVDSGTGNMFSNTTVVHGTNSKFSLKTDVDKSGIGITAYKSVNSNYYFMNFIANTTSVGDIYSNGTSTTYATTSDYRLKENVISVSDAITRLNQLNPVRFNFISHPDMTVDGFLAHEVQNVVPEAIKGIKDEMRDEEYEITPAVLDDDNNVVVEAVMGTRSVPDYQGIDQSKLVPLLTAALQESVAKIEALETRIAALESA